MDVFNEMLHDWQNFYFMAGGAAATLLGLMFVALSLATHLIDERTHENMKTFVTPSLFYFVSVLVLAGVMLIPSHTPLSFTVLMTMGGLYGLMRISPSTYRLVQAARKHQDFDLPEWIGQVIAPVGSYVLLVLAGVDIVLNQPLLALDGMCIATLALLVSAISNTWSLVLWIVDQAQTRNR